MLSWGYRLWSDLFWRLFNGQTERGETYRQVFCLLSSITYKMHSSAEQLSWFFCCVICNNTAPGAAKHVCRSSSLPSDPGNKLKRRIWFLFCRWSTRWCGLPQCPGLISRISDKVLWVTMFGSIACVCANRPSGSKIQGVEFECMK